VADEEFSDKEMAHLNEEYDISNFPEMKKAFAGPSADRETSSDKWGRWLSGYAPLINYQGYPVAIVGVDMAASDVDELRRNTRNVVMLSFVVGLILAIIFGRIGAVTITNPLMALMDGVKNLEQGKYGYQVNIQRKDEIGSLIQGFNQMSQKLGEVDKMKSDFLSVITHELYTPITPIKDCVSQLRSDPSLSESGQQLFGIIDRQVNKMQTLVDEVLDFSWLEIRDWKLEKEPIELKSLGAKILEDIKEQAAAKKVELGLKLGEQLPAMLLDRKRVQHVIRILLDNAIKFTPENGKVALEINKVSGGVEFAVSDSGIGISKKDTERIFSGFYQVEDHMTRTKGGMGLGLAIAKRIVEAHNGYIWAESPGLGEGSRFIFLLPIV
jgi:two-component system sensor histidine kinase GlrK